MSAGLSGGVGGNVHVFQGINSPTPARPTPWRKCSGIHTEHAQLSGERNLERRNSPQLCITSPMPKAAQLSKDEMRKRSVE